MSNDPEDKFELITQLAQLRIQLANEKEAHRKTFDTLERFIRDKIIVKLEDKGYKIHLSCSMFVSSRAIHQVDSLLLARAIGDEVRYAFERKMKEESENERV